MILRNILELPQISVTGLSPSLANHSMFFSYLQQSLNGVLQPPVETGFWLFRFRSPLLTESHSISFPRPTKMFQFRRLPLNAYKSLKVIFQHRVIRRSGPGFPIRTPPDRRLLDTFPTSFAVTPRPSSAQTAKAFIICIN